LPAPIIPMSTMDDAWEVMTQCRSAVAARNAWLDVAQSVAGARSNGSAENKKRLYNFRVAMND